MQYKTIMLEMLKQRPELYEQLRCQRTLLATMENYASELRIRHLAWKEQLSETNPECGQSQKASAALEIALHELEALLPAESPTDDSETLPLDQAMAFLIRHTAPV